jgi:hypothetical protein
MLLVLILALKKNDCTRFHRLKVLRSQYCNRPEGSEQEQAGTDWFARNRGLQAFHKHLAFRNLRKVGFLSILFELSGK